MTLSPVHEHVPGGQDVRRARNGGGADGDGQSDGDDESPLDHDSLR